MKLFYNYDIQMACKLEHRNEKAQHSEEKITKFKVSIPKQSIWLMD